jgi:AGZA family xanthine/uracil permease-like MFS transporter
MKASAFALTGAILTFFGFMHGEKIGIGQTPLVAVSYVAVALVLLYASKAPAGAPVAHTENADEAIHNADVQIQEG